METIQDIIDKGGPTPKEKKAMYKAIFKSIIESMYQTGAITDEHLKDPKKLKEILLGYAKNKQINISVDYRGDIIETARKYKKEKNYQYSTLFYAIFFEHTLNYIIEQLCARERIDKKTTNEIIKSVTIHGKLTWLLKLFKLPTINEKHKHLIIKNAEDRNAYVHYKYNSGNDDPKIDIAEEKRRISDLDKIEKTVVYIKRYESIILYNKKKKFFKKNIHKH